ncbi:MAG: ATP-binding protein [Xylophilus ampelinus]
MDTRTIAIRSAEICATTLQVAQAGYGSIEGLATHVRVEGDWSDPQRTGSLVGLYQFSDFGTYLDELRAGRTVAVEDVARDGRTNAHAEAFATLHIRSFLNVPLMHEDQLAGLYIVHHDQARPWTTDEIDFVRSLADRTWTAIDAAKVMERMQTVTADLELELRRRSADRNLLWQLSDDLMLVSRFDTRIVAVNPAWRKVLGWREEELVDRSLLELIHPDDLERTVEAAQVIQGGATLSSFGNRYRCKDGSYRCISWSAGPAEDFLVATGRDVTSAYEQEEALRQAEDQLRQSQKMEAVGQLTVGIAHDFNNLLTIISTSVHLLRRKGQADLRFIRLVDSIDGAVGRASKLTGQLLAFARKQSLKPVVFDAEANIVAMAEMLQTLIGSRVTLSIIGDGAGYWVDADPGQFDTAIVNMAANARDAMQRVGSLTIVFERVDSKTEPGRRFTSVAVRDTGAGIAAEDLQRIFDPFYTTKPVGEGTGLGLSQVFGFAQQSGGDVKVRSALNQGTTFTLCLPAATRQVTEKPKAAPPSIGSQSGGTVLLVEDNLDVATAAQAALTDIGYSVYACPSGAEALAILERMDETFVAVFSDVMMAGMDGVALAREIRQRHPSLPVLLASGYSDVLARSEAFEFPLLAKPYGLDTLAASLQEVIRGE